MSGAGTVGNKVLSIICGNKARIERKIGARRLAMFKDELRNRENIVRDLARRAG